MAKRFISPFLTPTALILLDAHQIFHTQYYPQSLRSFLPPNLDYEQWNERGSKLCQITRLQAILGDKLRVAGSLSHKGLKLESTDVKKEYDLRTGPRADQAAQEGKCLSKISIGPSASIVVVFYSAPQASPSCRRRL
jgi:hypothetical protein